MTEFNNDQVVTETPGAQLRFARGLAGCSQILLRPVHGEEERALALRNALEQLRQATGTSRAFLYRNFDDPELGLCSGAVAVAYDPKYPPDSTVPWLVRKIPWSIAPEQAWHSLKAGKPFGGVVEAAFATTPDFLSRCSRVLHQVTHSEGEEITILTRALEHLRLAVRAGRAYLFENFTDPELGSCIGMQAEACAPDVSPHINNPANRRVPWSELPPEMCQTLVAGEP